MAKASKSINFKNAQIDKAKNLITEVSKDDTKFYSLSKLIDEWNGIEGVSITIKKDDELESDSEGNDE